MSRYLVISSSLNPGSKSLILAKAVTDELKKEVDEVGFIDLKELSLPLCDGATVYGNPAVVDISKRIAHANCVLLAVPVYNYAVGASAKNLIELTGRSWLDKTVGFLCAAGGRASYMSVMNLANSLMLDFRCAIIPRFVYAEGPHFADGSVKDPEVQERIVGLAKAARRFSKLYDEAI